MVILDSGMAILDLHEDFSEAAACLPGCPAGVPADDRAAQGFVTYERFRRFLTAEPQPTNRSSKPLIHSKSCRANAMLLPDKRRRGQAPTIS